MPDNTEYREWREDIDTDDESFVAQSVTVSVYYSVPGNYARHTEENWSAHINMAYQDGHYPSSMERHMLETARFLIEKKMGDTELPLWTYEEFTQALRERLNIETIDRAHDNVSSCSVILQQEFVQDVGGNREYTNMGDDKFVIYVKDVGTYYVPCNYARTGLYLRNWWRQ